MIKKKIGEWLMYKAIANNVEFYLIQSEQNKIWLVLFTCIFGNKEENSPIPLEERNKLLIVPKIPFSFGGKSSYFLSASYIW